MHTDADDVARDLDRALDGDLDRFLASEEILMPSSGFAAGVMESVRAAAEEPPPLAAVLASVGALRVRVAAARP